MTPKQRATASHDYEARHIRVLKGLEAVRKRPAMYIGTTGSRGLHHLFNEVVDNAIDEALAGFCTEIEAVLHADQSISVHDNGRGIPVDIHPDEKKPGVEIAMTVLHAGSKFGGGGYKVSGGLHGVGVSVVNALSEWLEVEVHRGKKAYTQRFARGKPTTGLKEIGKAKDTGTRVTFLPDKEVFEEVKFDPAVLAHRLRELAYLNKNVVIRFTDEATGETQTFHEETGIKGLVEDLNKAKTQLHPALFFANERDGTAVEVAMQYTDGMQETILTYANNIHTAEGGTHLSGFKTALTRVINTHARKAGLLKERDSNFQGDEVREGLTGVISVKLLNPQFEGQTKTKLGNTELEGVVNSLVGEALAEYLEKNPSNGRKIITKALTAQRAREAARKAADLIRRKGALDGGGLPGTLADCRERDRDKCELFIVEGKSAGGNAKTGRDSQYQAILPLRGKILNVEKARFDKILEHSEIATLISALGAGIMNNHTDNGSAETTSQFNLDELRYGRVIIMTDADVDGAHIRTLLLTFFYRYMRGLIEGGHLFVAQPPLYSVRVKNDRHYIRDDKELQKFLKTLKGKPDEITRFKGLGEMDAGELALTTMDRERRTLQLVTLDDAAEAEKLFSVLMGDQVEPRRDYIMKHALAVKELDV